jgi:hypothetical protein
MEFKDFNKIARLSREITVTEKIDGTNGQIAIWEKWDVPSEQAEDGMIDIVYDGTSYIVMAGSRTRWISTAQDNAGFARWVKDNVGELVKLGVGFHFGEWWGRGIQRGYGLSEKRFSLFNTARWGDDTVRPACCYVVPVLYKGVFDTVVIQDVLNDLAFSGSRAVPGFMNPEGVVIYHAAGNMYFKKTIKNDEKPKSSLEIE